MLLLSTYAEHEKQSKQVREKERWTEREPRTFEIKMKAELIKEDKKSQK